MLCLLGKKLENGVVLGQGVATGKFHALSTCLRGDRCVRKVDGEERTYGDCRHPKEALECLMERRL
jgi:hypothetical protein